MEWGGLEAGGTEGTSGSSSMIYTGNITLGTDFFLFVDYRLLLLACR